jgi:ADP-ribosylglycohydrolase
MSDADTDILARARGCLLGQIAGDSLGGLVEFRTAERIRSEYPEGVRELQDGGHWRTLAGQPTDDSELALALARAIVARCGFEEEPVAQAYARWLASEPFDCGNTIERSLAAAMRADPGDVAATARRSANLTSQANGALMRVSPLGVLGHASDPAMPADWARRDASLTHPHPVCRDANAVFAVGIAYAIRTGDRPAGVYSAAVEWAKREEFDEDVRATIWNAARENAADFSSQMGWVRIALQNAFYQLLHADSLEAGVVDTVMRGGDTDTNAAIAGALLGAVYGERAIPSQWRESVLNCRPEAGQYGVRRPRPREYWPVDVLELAAALVSIGSRVSAGGT